MSGLVNRGDQSLLMWIGYRLLEEVVSNARGYFNHRGMEGVQFTRSFDSNQREYLVELAVGLFGEGGSDTADGIVRWLNGGDIIDAFLRHALNTQAVSGNPQGNLLGRLRCATIVDSKRHDELTNSSVAWCLKELRGLAANGLSSRLRESFNSLQASYERFIATRKGLRVGAGSGNGPGSLPQGFSQLEGTLRLPWVRRRVALRILSEAKSALERSSSGGGPELEALANDDSSLANVGRDGGEVPPCTTSGGLSMTGEESGLEGLQAHAKSSIDARKVVPSSLPYEAMARPESRGLSAESSPQAGLGLGHVCLGNPIRIPFSRRRRRVELTPITKGTGGEETERSDLDCTTSTIRVPISTDAVAISVTFEGGYEIEDLLDLESAYLAWKRSDKAAREAELDPDAPALPPLRPRGLRIGCGHLDCGGDIADLERTEDVCPHCHRRIISRCGNPDCLGEDLHIDAHGNDERCPDCGGVNRNRHWQCDRHPDQGWLSRSEQPTCRECERERALALESRLRQNIGRAERCCPGCLAQGVARPLVVPRSIEDMAGAEMPVEASPVNRARCRAAGLPEDGACPRCRGQLIPFVPSPRITSSAVLCGRCRFPHDPVNRGCPRCRAELDSCSVCASIVPDEEDCARSVRPLKSEVERSATGDRCARCATTQIPIRHGIDPSLLIGRICTNVYGCPVGGGLASSTRMVLLADSVESCPVCRQGDLKPIDVAVFVAEVMRCGYCPQAMGDPRRWRTASLMQDPAVTGDEIENSGGNGSIGNGCRVCGRSARSVEDLEAQGDVGDRGRAALALGKALWVAKSADAVQAWIAHNGWVERYTLGPRDAAEWLFEQTAPPWSEGLHVRLATLGWHSKAAG